MTGWFWRLKASQGGVDVRTKFLNRTQDCTHAREERWLHIAGLQSSLRAERDYTQRRPPTWRIYTEKITYGEDIHMGIPTERHTWRDIHRGTHTNKHTQSDAPGETNMERYALRALPPRGTYARRDFKERGYKRRNMRLHTLREYTRRDTVRTTQRGNKWRGSWSQYTWKNSQRKIVKERHTESI